MLSQNRAKVYSIILILISAIYANLDYGINYELRYSDGKIEETNFFENYFDINLYYKDLYLYTLLIHKDPPLIGSPAKEIEDILSSIYEKDHVHVEAPDYLDACLPLQEKICLLL